MKLSSHYLFLLTTGQGVNYIAVDMAEHLKAMPTQTDINYLEDKLKFFIKDKRLIKNTFKEKMAFRRLF